MNENSNHNAGDERHGITEAALLRLDRLCEAFSHASAIGFAILDDKLRYQTINDALAAINGIPASAHVGNTIQEVFGDEIAGQIEPRVRRLVLTGNAECFELNATLPTRREPGSWIDHYFAIRDQTGKVNRIGVVVVEVTQQRKLDAFINELTRDLLAKESKECWWVAGKLHECIDDYHAALGMSIGQLARTPDKAPELLEHAVESLDQRILAMREIVIAVASRFAMAGNSES